MNLSVDSYIYALKVLSASLVALSEATFVLWISSCRRRLSAPIINFVSIVVIKQIRVVSRDEYIFADIQVNGRHGNHPLPFYLNQSFPSAYLQWKPPAVFVFPLHALPIEVLNIPNSSCALLAQSNFLFSSTQKTALARGLSPNL